jgi:hypothetical protein
MAYNKFLKNNNRKLKIISLNQNNDQIIIKYHPSVKITTSDKIKIHKSNSQPSLVGHTGKVVQSNGTDTVIISAFINGSLVELDENGTEGTIILKTTFESQLFNTISDTTETITDFGKDVSGSVFEGLFEGLGIDIEELKKYLKIGGIIVAVLFGIYIISQIIKFANLAGFKTTSLRTVQNTGTTQQSKLLLYFILFFLLCVIIYFIIVNWDKITNKDNLNALSN